jgi:2-isopropylmalate synthase
VNSQSGKGGVAYILEQEFGIDLPKDLQREFGPIANDAVDALGREVTGPELRGMFWKEYIERTTPWSLDHFHDLVQNGTSLCQVSIRRDGNLLTASGSGNGHISAFVAAMRSVGAPDFEILDYREQALGKGTDATALAFVQISTPGGKRLWGGGVDTNSELAPLRAILSALNRLG